jgi:hypothetical protein
VFPHRTQLDLPELAAAHGHGTHRQGSALPMTGSEGHSGPRSAVGDGRAHVVLLYRWSCGRPPARERKRATRVHSGVNPHARALPGHRRIYWIVQDEHPARCCPRFSSAVKATPRLHRKYTCYRMAPAWVTARSSSEIAVKPSDAWLCDDRAQVGSPLYPVAGRTPTSGREAPVDRDDDPVSASP